MRVPWQMGALEEKLVKIYALILGFCFCRKCVCVGEVVYCMRYKSINGISSWICNLIWITLSTFYDLYSLFVTCRYVVEHYFEKPVIHNIQCDGQDNGIQERAGLLRLLSDAQTEQGEIVLQAYVLSRLRWGLLPDNTLQSTLSDLSQELFVLREDLKTSLGSHTWRKRRRFLLRNLIITNDQVRFNDILAELHSDEVVSICCSFVYLIVQFIIIFIVI